MKHTKEEFFKEFPSLMHWIRESEKVSTEYEVGGLVWEWIEEAKREWEEAKNMWFYYLGIEG